MMSVREDEKEAIENWSERHPDVEVGIDEGELQNSETVNPLSCWDCGLHGMDSKSCCCGLDENHRLLRG